MSKKHNPRGSNPTDGTKPIQKPRKRVTKWHRASVNILKGYVRGVYHSALAERVLKSRREKATIVVLVKVKESSIVARRITSSR